MNTVINLWVASCLILLGVCMYALFNTVKREEKQHPITCESKGEVLESFRYDEDKKQIVIQCKR